MTISIPAVAHRDTCTAPAGLSVVSTTTTMGNRSHLVTTQDSALAWAIYEHALAVDIEPERTKTEGIYSVYFIAEDCDASTVIAAARGGVQ